MSFLQAPRSRSGQPRSNNFRLSMRHVILLVSLCALMAAVFATQIQQWQKQRQNVRQTRALQSAAEALSTAIEANDTHEVKRILSSTTNVRLLNFRYALRTAVGYGNLEVVRLLLAQDGLADLPADSQDELLEPAIFSSQPVNTRVSMCKLLIDQAGQPSEATIEHLRRQTNALHDEAALETMRRVGIPITPEQLAAFGHLTELQELLEDASARSHADREELGKLLQSACSGGQRKVVQFLIERGGDVTYRNHVDETCLHLAAIHNDASLIRLLAEHGAEVDALDSWGTTPLMHAVSYGRPKTVQALLELGADPNIRDQRGNTVVQRLGDRHGIDEALKQLLIEFGAQPSSQHINEDLPPESM